MKFLNIVIPLALFITGCASTAEHRANVQDESGDKLTVGTIQKEIRVGMSGADVAGVLGAPNIVSTDEKRREVWVYDKISTETAYSTSSGGIATLIFGGSGTGLLSGSSNAGASSSSQKTLTVVIKFDENDLVRDFAYNSSSF